MGQFVWHKAAWIYKKTCNISVPSTLKYYKLLYELPSKAISHQLGSISSQHFGSHCDKIHLDLGMLNDKEVYANILEGTKLTFLIPKSISDFPSFGEGVPDQKHA